MSDKIDFTELKRLLEADDGRPAIDIVSDFARPYFVGYEAMRERFQKAEGCFPGEYRRRKLLAQREASADFPVEAKELDDREICLRLARLLLATHLSFADIVDFLGLENVKVATKIFKKMLSVTPKEFRARMWEAKEEPPRLANKFCEMAEGNYKTICLRVLSEFKWNESPQDIFDEVDSSVNSRQFSQDFKDVAGTGLIWSRFRQSFQVDGRQCRTILGLSENPFEKPAPPS